MVAPEKLAKIQQLKADYNKAVEELGQDALKDMFRDFFTAHPEVDAIQWHQYTPYFNDGESCVFGINEFYYRLTDQSNSDPDDDDGFCYLSHKEKSKWAEAIRSMNRTADSLEDVFESAFGDHAKIVATRDGFSVDEYSHD